MRIYQMKIEDVASALGSDLYNGVTGKNKKTVRVFNSMASFFRSLLSLMRSKFNCSFIISIACYIVALVFSWLNKSFGLFNLSISALILTIVLYLIEAILLCSYKKKYYERSVRSRQSVHIIRGGVGVDVDPSELIVGDLICLEPGTVLYCDARLISSDGLFAEEANVFGSTIPSAKDAAPIDDENLSPNKQKNMVWKGSYIANGSGRAFVTALDDDCYIAKTGGRKRRKQRSFFFNMQNNIGRITLYAFLIFTAIFLLIAGLITGNFVEIFLVMGVMSSVLFLNPVACLTEWTYYRTASLFYRQGVLIRNIEAFDGMNKEKELYFEANKLISERLHYSHTVDFHGSEKSTLSYFSLCMGRGYFTDELRIPLNNYNVTFNKLDRNFPVFRRETDAEGNCFSLFSRDGSSVVVAAGYWKKMLPMVKTLDETLLNQIKELEIHGKMVYIMANDTIDYIPSRLDSSYFSNRMELASLVVFDISFDSNLLSMIGQLRHTSMKVYLINDYSEELAHFLMTCYDMDGILDEYPTKKCYSIPTSQGGGPVVYENTSSPIEREQAEVVLKSDVLPQDLIYKVKCMFCGIRRCLNFMAMVGALLVLTVFTILLRSVPLDRTVFSLLLIKPALICVCYSLIETVQNCNRFRRSLILGLLCGLAGLISAFVGCETVLLTLSLSMVLLSGYLMFTAVKFKSIHIKAVSFLILSLLIVLIPLFITGGYWLPAFLLALYPPLAAFIIDLFY